MSPHKIGGFETKVLALYALCALRSFDEGGKKWLNLSRGLLPFYVTGAPIQALILREQPDNSIHQIFASFI
jgi:hypothetical protein